jgi:hypothetical protein
MTLMQARVETLFEPVNGWCYQDVLPLPPIDEIKLSASPCKREITSRSCH